MALSEEEARLLAQLEQSLAAEDPDFASTLRGSKIVARNRRLAVVGSLAALLGIAVLLVGAMSASTWVGVLGFLLMIGGGYLFATAWRSGFSGADDDAAAGGSPKSSGSFVDRMEERWQRRSDEGFS